MGVLRRCGDLVLLRFCGLRLSLIALSVVAASCSAIDLNGDDDSSPTRPTLGNEASDEVVAGPADRAEGVAEEDATGERPSIWVRADDAVMRPDQPTASLSDAVSPDEGRPWTVVGSEFDYESNRSLPVVWEAESPDGSNPWVRTDVPAGPGDDAAMIGIARTERMDVVVGSRGRDREQRPAVWVRAGTGGWENVDSTQFDGAAQEWLIGVAAGTEGGPMLARGVTVTDINKRVPILWASNDGATWTRAANLPFSDDGSDELRGIAVGAERSVITGWQDAGANEVAVAWWSEDGETWNEARIEIPAGVDDSYLGEVVWFDGRFVTVGGLSSDGAYRPVAWTSEDGSEWALQPRRFDVNDDGRQSTIGLGAIDLAVAGERLLATAFGTFLQHVWSSSDGSEWAPVENIWRVRPNGVGINGLAGTDEQVLVTTPEPDILFHGPRWSQSEIRTETVPSPVEIPYVNDVTATTDGWVAVGGLSTRFRSRDRTQEAESWFSEDGMTWTASQRLPSSGLGAMNAAASLDGRVVAVGTESLDSADRRNRQGRSMLWELADDWDIVDAPALESEDRISMLSAAVAGEAVVAGGWTYVGDNVDAMLVDSNSGLQRRVDIGNSGGEDERVVAVCGAPDGAAAALVSITAQDGGTTIAASSRTTDGVWSAASFPERAADLDHVGVASCVHGVDGFVAAGWSKGGTNDDIVLWRSDDGTTWEAVEGPPGFTNEANQWLNTAAPTEDGYVLAGMDASSGLVLPTVWFGSGDQWRSLTVQGPGDDSTVDMNSLDIAVNDETIVVIGRKNGAERVYVTTVEQLVAELNTGP